MLRIQVRNEKQSEEFEHNGEPLEFGRGPDREAKRFRVNDVSVSRDHLWIQELPDGRLRVENLSQRIAIQLSDQSTMAPGVVREFALPVLLTLGKTQIRIERAAAPGSSPERPRLIKEPPPAQIRLTSTGSLDTNGLLALADHGGTLDRVRMRRLLRDPNTPPTPDMLAHWLETVIALQQGVTASPEFYTQTARAVVDLVGLDLGLVVLRKDDSWNIVGTYTAHDAVNIRVSRTLLNHVVHERQTFYQDVAQFKSAAASLEDIDAVVVSPIFGLNDDVVGVLYGVRTRDVLIYNGISPLEAQFVQLLAAAVGANLARTAATRTRVQFEQFFSPELVRELERDTSILEGRNQEVTILVSDLRGFTSLSQRLGAENTCKMVRDLMGQLTEQIVEHGGVIVDYAGDGILAMWNAPVKQDDHAARASMAALAMLGEMPALNARWMDVAGCPLSLGIGVNTGPALVGNTGSQRKFKYGPHGHTVNLASRVQDATKKLGLPLLITGSTRSQLPTTFATRRLGQVRLANVAEPVMLYELCGDTSSAEWLARRDAYETALGLYESRQWCKACQALMPLLEIAEQRGQYDTPTLKLMRRAWECLETPSESFDPSIEITTK